MLLDMLHPRELQGHEPGVPHRAAAARPPARPARSADWLLRGGQPAAVPTVARRKRSSPAPAANGTQVTPLARRPIQEPPLLVQSSVAAIGSVPARERLPLIDFGKARAVLAALAATPTPGGPVAHVCAVRAHRARPAAASPPPAARVERASRPPAAHGLQPRDDAFEIRL